MSKRRRSVGPAASRIGEPLGVMVDVRESLIPGAGLGLFARVPVTKNQVLTWYAGRTLDRAQAAAVKDPSFLRSTEFDVVIDGIRIPQAGEGAASFANHARGVHKNVKFVTVFDAAIHANRIVLKALRDITADEEILVDYGRHFWHRLGQLPASS